MSPAGSKTLARYQTAIMGTQEAQSVLLTGIRPIKPINGKIVQVRFCEGAWSNRGANTPICGGL